MRCSRESLQPTLRTILCLLFSVLIVQGAWGQDRSCMEVTPDSLNFYGNLCNDWLYQEDIEGQPIYIQAVCGDTGLYWEISSSEPWISVTPEWRWDSDSALVWLNKEQLIGTVPDSLPPGDTLRLEAIVTVTAGDPVIPPQTVVVSLFLDCTPPDLLLLVQPGQLTFEAPPGDTLQSSLWVFEAHGESVHFDYTNSSEWLWLPVPFTPQYTPDSILAFVVTTGLAPGYYYDTIFVNGYPDSAAPPFQTVAVPVTLHVTGGDVMLATSPAYFHFTVPLGGVAAESLLVYEIHGQSIGFWTYNACNWLYVDTMSAIPLYTPEVLWLEVNAGWMAPGIYTDTVFIWASEADNSPLLVPVTLEVTGGSDEYVVQTVPTEFNVILSQGEGAADSLHIFEIHGHNVPLNVVNTQPWLVLDPFPMPPFVTPTTFIATFGTWNLPPGTYVDTIVVSPIHPDFVFDTVWVPVTVTIHGGPVLIASPDHFEITVPPGGMAGPQGFFVYETHGDSVPFAADVVGGSPWLHIEETVPYNIYVTPDSVFFSVFADTLPQGIYVDTILLWPPWDSIPFPPVAVPVRLTIGGGGGEYIIDALPSEFNVVLPPGESFYDSLYVWEIHGHGHNVPFQIYNSYPWLAVDPFPMPPYVTPMTFVVAIGSQNLPPGQYSDTIVISAPDPEYPFETVLVPVTLTIDSSEYCLVVEPTEFNYTVHMDHYFYDYLHIEELHGDTLLLNFYNTQPWLSIPLFFTAPPTPMTLEFGISTEGLLPGTYSDVITIYGYADNSQPPVDVAHVPVTLTVTEGQPFVVHAAPDHFEFVVHQGAHFFTEYFLVYDEDSANLVFATTLVNNSEWLTIDSGSANGVTPSHVYFHVSTDGLEPGTYGDSVLIYYPLDDMYGFDDVLVPVILHILSDTLDAIVATEPESFSFVVQQGETHIDELYIYEIHGGTVPFMMWNQTSWLDFGFCLTMPLITPCTSPFVVDTDSLDPGNYYDTITIWPDTDGVSFPPVAVPVTLTVLPVGSTPDDSLIIPSISVLPCDWECVVQPVQTKLSQPIKGATIPISIPDGVEICSLSTSGLITEGWDWTFSEVNDSLGYVFMALANSFNAQIPVGVTGVFNIYFNIAPECRENLYFHWDTTLMLSFSKHLAYTDTTYTTVNPGFDMFRDSVEVRGYTPGNYHNDPQLDISDLVGVVDYMFTYGPPPCVMNALDVNGDCMGPDISDLVALIDYMFMAWDPPPEFPPELSCGCITDDGNAVAKLNPDISVSALYQDGNTVLILSSPVDLRGLQLELRTVGDPGVQKLTGDELDLIHGESNGFMKVGILDLDGADVIAAGKTPVIRLSGEVEIVNAVVTDGRYISMAAVVKGSGDGLLPDGFSLGQNYPNPFNPKTTISFNLPQPSPVTLEVFNITGQKVATLVNGPRAAGEHTVSWDAHEMSSGVYFYKLTTSQYNASRKMVLLK